MSDPIFYVGSMDDNHPLTGYVRAKFLTVRGQPVVDPTPGGSQNSYIYPDASNRYKTDGKIANPNNYLIVPANYSEQQAREFAAEIANTDSADVLGRMKVAFQQGGPQDIQRHPQWGIPKGAVVPAFVGGASYHLGSVTGLAGLSPEMSEIGGGAANWLNGHIVQPWNRLWGERSTKIDSSGPRGLSQHNYDNFTKGYVDATALPNPEWLDNFADGSQSQTPTGRIGDGRGVANWITSQDDIDPGHPAPSPGDSFGRLPGFFSGKEVPQRPVRPPIFNTR